MSQTLKEVFDRYRSNFKTKTRDSSEHGWTVLKGYLLLESERNYTNIDQKVNGVEADGQTIQQFMSDSPWSWQGVFEQVTKDINSSVPIVIGIPGGTLHFDESGDECSGPHKAGAARQYLGRPGKVDMGQVGVLSSYSKDGVWLLTGAELYLPQTWFEDPAKIAQWKPLGIPQDREFATKIAIARGLFDQAIEQKLNFEWTGGDTLYGRDIGFRRHIASYDKYYMMCIPNDELVWLDNPLVADKESVAKHVSELGAQAGFEPIHIRDAERGSLVYEYAFVPVWTVNKGAPVAKRQATTELLVVRKEPDGSTSYALTNANLQTVSKHTIAVQRAERYFIERTIQDSKSELGWDELQARKYPAYMHSLAICALALVFLAQVKLAQRPLYEKPEKVKRETGLNRLPDISLANVKELMRSVMPMPQLSKKQARQKVIQTLFDRTLSTASRVRKQKVHQKASKKNKSSP